MPRNPVLGGVARDPARSLSSIACLAFIGLMALAFWAGAIWIAQLVLRALFGG
jgi:hypothetical protein